MLTDCERPELIAQELKKAKDASLANMERLKDLKNRNDQIQEIITQTIIDKLQMSRHIDNAIRVSTAPDGCKSKNRTTDTNPHVPLSLIVIFLILISGAQLMASTPSPSTPKAPCECSNITNATAEESCLHKAATHQRLGDFGKAYDYWSMAIAEYEREGKRPITALAEKAYCAYRLGNHKAALRTCDELEKCDSNSARAAYTRGLVYEKLEKWAEASKSYRLALLRGEAFAAHKLKKVEGR